jgi:hypothetical protein
MSKQTATDYLIQEIKNDSLVQAKSTQEWNEVFRKAKQMECEQIEEAWHYGSWNWNNDKTGKNFYKETYGDKK